MLQKRCNAQENRSKEARGYISRIHERHTPIAFLAPSWEEMSIYGSLLGRWGFASSFVRTCRARSISSWDSVLIDRASSMSRILISDNRWGHLVCAKAAPKCGSPQRPQFWKPTDFIGHLPVTCVLPQAWQYRACSPWTKLRPPYPWTGTP